VAESLSTLHPGALRPGVTRLKGPLVDLALAGAAGCMGAAAFVYLADGGNMKVIAAALAGALGLVVAVLCGNPRLCCLWALMLVIPLDLSKRFGEVFLKMGGESSFRAEISDVFIVGLLAYQLRDIWTRRVDRVRIPKVTYLWILIMLMGGAWAIFGTWRLTAAHEVFRMFKVMLLFLVLCHELANPTRILHAAAALTLAVLAQAIVALIQYTTRSHLGLEILGETGSIAIKMLESSSVRGQSVFRVGAFLSHPNVFGAFLACLLPLAISGFFLKVGRAYRLFFLGTATLGMMALIVTLSRSGWLSFAVAFAALMLLTGLHPGLRRRSILAAGVATVSLLVISAAFFEPITSRIFSSRDAAMLGRAEYIRDAKGLIAARPWLGWGLNSYVFAVPPFTQYGARGASDHYEDWIPPVHNIYYLWWAETGLIGLALHLLVLGAVMRAAVANLRVADQVLFALNAACLAGIVALGIDGFFSFSLRFNSILRVFWALAAIVMAVRYCRARAVESMSPSARRLTVDQLLPASGLAVPTSPGFGR
jgi:putative inorganic carbon (hco3(-)) transporter